MAGRYIKHPPLPQTWRRAISQRLPIFNDNVLVKFCRTPIIVDRAPQEHTKTKHHRVVLSIERVLNAINQAQRMAALRRMALKPAHPVSPFVFQPSKGGLWINEPSVTIRPFKSALKALSIRERWQYDTRHTSAPLCRWLG